MPRRLQRRRNNRGLIRRLQQRQRWSTHVLSAGHKCQILKLSSSILRANTPSPLCPLNWWMCKLKRTSATTDVRPGPLKEKNKTKKRFRFNLINRFSVHQGGKKMTLGTTDKVWTLGDNDLQKD